MSNPQLDFDADHARWFLSHVLDPSVGCAELRILNASWAPRGSAIEASSRFPTTFNGYFDDLDVLLVEIQRVKGVNAYVTVNPVHRDLLAQAGNEIVKCARNGGANDSHIVCHRWAYTDLDVVRASNASNISATAAELAAVVSVRDTILADLPDLAASSIWGGSGNGGWILTRLPDLPINAENDAAVARLLDFLAHGYNSTVAKVDTKTKNPSRIMGIAGMRKCKGDNIPGRPWRLATIDSPEGHEPVPFDLKAWLDLNDPVIGNFPVANLAGGAQSGQPGSAHGPGAIGHPAFTGRPDEDVVRWARAFVNAIPGAISGQDGHKQTFSAATALVKGFDLSIAESWPILRDYNFRCQPQWTEQELWHKLESAHEKPDGRPRGYLVAERKANAMAAVAVGAGMPAGHQVVDFGGNGNPLPPANVGPGNPGPGKSSETSNPPARYEQGNGLMKVTTWNDHGIANNTVLISTFSAQIVQITTKDDGAQKSRTFKIEARSSRNPQLIKSVEVPAAEFEKMNWVVLELDPDFRIEATRSARDHVRNAIQYFSDQRVERTIYAHTGWREIDEGWVYLHAGGAIGADGNDPSIAVEVEGNGARYRLPDPPEGQDLVRAIRASLGILDLARDEEPGTLVAAAVLLSAIYRAAIRWADFCIQINGHTGSFKTSFAALASQHYGVEMNEKNCPASWETDTPLAIQDLATRVGDAVLVVDDLVFRGSSQDILKKQHDSQQFVQGIGNHAGRNRLNNDSSPRPGRPPNCLPIMTGEDRMPGGSADARTLPVRFTRGMIDKAALKLRQKDADSGLYAASMAGYIRWLAPQLDEVRAEMATSIPTLRDRLFKDGDHGRTPEIVANLFFGARTFLRFALDVGAINPEEHEAHLENVMRGLTGASDEMRADREEQLDPCQLYISLVRAALLKGRAYLCRIDNDDPPDGRENSCGWRRVAQNYGVGMGASVWETWPNSERIGWVDDETVYLHPGNAFSIARKMAEDGGPGFATSKQTLHKLLLDEEIIDRAKGTGRNRDGKNRAATRVCVGRERTRTELLAIHSRRFWGDESPNPSSD